MRGSSLLGTLKLLAALLLGTCLLLPFYSLPEADGSRTHHYAWDEWDGEWGTAGLIAIAFLWPLLPALLRVRGKSRWHRLAGRLVEPVLAVFSISLVVAIHSSAFAIVPILGPWLMVPVSGSPAVGTTLGLAANGILLVIWLAELIGSGRSALLRKRSSRWAGSIVAGDA